MIVTLTPLRTSYFPYLTSFNLHNKCIRQVLGLPLSIFQTLGKLGKLAKSQTANKQLEQNQNPGFLQAPGASHCVISSIFLFHFFLQCSKISFILPWIYGLLVKSPFPKLSDSLPDTEQLNSINCSPNIVRNLRLLRVSMQLLPSIQVLKGRAGSRYIIERK